MRIVWIYPLTEAIQDTSKMYAKVAVPADFYLRI
jgi:hypothetical protein